MKRKGQAKAERQMEQALRSEGVGAQHLLSCRKRHPFKIELAAKLREQTTVRVTWIAQRLVMGSRGHLMHLFYPNGKATDSGNGPLTELGNMTLLLTDT